MQRNYWQDLRDAVLVKATSGEEALRALLAEDFALILLDVRMPGMSGLETARLIRQRPRTRYTPIIFMTAADTTPEQVKEAYSAGAADYLFKPFVPEVLVAKVKVFVEPTRGCRCSACCRSRRLTDESNRSQLG